MQLSPLDISRLENIRAAVTAFVTFVQEKHLLDKPEEWRMLYKRWNAIERRIHGAIHCSKAMISVADVHLIFCKRSLFHSKASERIAELSREHLGRFTCHV
jgi:hypothetical protein